MDENAQMLKNVLIVDQQMFKISFEVINHA